MDYRYLYSSTTLLSIDINGCTSKNKTRPARPSQLDTTRDIHFNVNIKILQVHIILSIIIMNFFVNLLILLAASTIAPTYSAEIFDYDPSSAFGPPNWAKLDIANNQCGGMRQSGINIVSSSCSEFDAPYTFNVSNI
jgi:hypothetical protein